ncbi:MAG: lysoplasmalogenase [Ruminiclostridium sp.]|nr:lysoplasmalogenase [Ruminiclostridium sp.]
MKKTKSVVINIIITFAVLLFAVLFLVTGSLVSKAAASVCFIALGIINCIAEKNRLTEYKTFSVLLIYGLFMAMLGDIFINHIVVVGAALFAVGHILFLAAQHHLCPKEKRKPVRDIICGLGLFAVNMSVLTFAPLRYTSDSMRVLCLVYTVIISLMTGKAISNYIGSGSTIFRLMLIGTVLFMLSDLFLLLYCFMGNSDVIHYISIILYYASEIILADSFIILARKKQ